MKVSFYVITWQDIKLLACLNNSQSLPILLIFEENLLFPGDVYKIASDFFFKWNLSIKVKCPILPFISTALCAIVKKKIIHKDISEL